MIQSPTLLVALAILATTRVTRLVTDDMLLDVPRGWLTRRVPDWIAYLIGCAWCASIWVAAIVASVTYAWHGSWVVQIGLLALSASWVTGFLAKRTGD